MCLAIPGKIIAVDGTDPLLRSARVSFDGVVKQVNLACAPEAQLGDFVLVHVGVAISIIDPDEAEHTLRYLAQLGELEEIHRAECGPTGQGSERP
jgi:hydrogenase expression/formation protein HypC